MRRGSASPLSTSGRSAAVVAQWCRYYDEGKFTDLASEKKFEKDLMSKTARLNNRNDGMGEG